MENRIPSEPTQPSFSLLLKSAMSPDVAPEKLAALLAVKKDWEAAEAKKAYSFALAEFTRRCPIVEKGDFANERPYARMDRIWRTVRPLLGELGLAPTRQVCALMEDGQLCHIEGSLLHRDGYETKIVQDVPLPELIKGQNKSQQMGSAETYAWRYAICGALGIVTGEDDDGNGGVKSTLDTKEVQEIKTLLDVWRGTPAYTEEKEWVFWRFAGAPKLTNGGHDFGKISGERFGDLKWYLERAIKSVSK